RLPAASAAPSLGARPARRGRLGVLPARLDQRHRRGVRRNHRCRGLRRARCRGQWLEADMTAPRFGVNTFIWRSPFSTATDLDLVGHAASLGAEVFEVAVEQLELVDAAGLRSELDDHGLAAVVCGAFGPDRDIGSADPSLAAGTKEYVV